MEKNNNFENTVKSLFDGFNGFLSTKTVVSDAIHMDDTILLPLVDVSFGMGAGSKGSENKNAGAGGMGGKTTPSAVIVVKGDNIKLINIKNQDTVTKVLDMMPDFIDKVKNKFVKSDDESVKDDSLSEEEVENVKEVVK